MSEEGIFYLALAFTVLLILIWMLFVFIIPEVRWRQYQQRRKVQSDLQQEYLRQHPGDPKS